VFFYEPWVVSCNLEVDRVYAKLDQILAMAVGPLRVILAALLLENNDLLAATLAEDRGPDRRAGDERSADLRLIAAHHQHFAERDLVLVGAAEGVTLDRDDIALGDAILLSTGTNDGVHNCLREVGTVVVAQSRMSNNAHDRSPIPTNLTPTRELLIVTPIRSSVNN